MPVYDEFIYVKTGKQLLSLCATFTSFIIPLNVRGVGLGLQALSVKLT